MEAIREVAGRLKEAIERYGPQGVALLISPGMTNEELFRIHQLFRDHLKIQNIETKVPDNRPVYSDDFLITADKNPNTRGVGVLYPASPGSEELLEACAAGRIHFLYIFQQDLALGHDLQRVREALGKVDCVVFQGSWLQATAGLAHIQLPSAVYAEKEGTFTNVQGRVQRFQAAVPPIRQSLPDLEILARLAAELGTPLSGTSAEEVFREIGKSFEAFAGMTYQTVGATGQLLK
jgi:predicted molibdopterin-dependent oxidoreductase YjgC